MCTARHLLLDAAFRRDETERIDAVLSLDTRIRRAPRPTAMCIDRTVARSALRPISAETVAWTDTDQA